MTDSVPIELSVAQRKRLDRFRAPQCVDIHSHCLPGLDDGPATVAQAMALCRALVDDGITAVVATPHQLGRYDGRNAPRDVRQATMALNELLRKDGVPLTVLAGADVRADERIMELLETDRILTLADLGRDVMVELPHEALLDLRPLLAELAPRGIRVIISHPERHAVLARETRLLRSLVEHGAWFQITAASLIGHFGPSAQDVAWHLLGAFRDVIVASDAHDVTERRPCMTAAIDLIAERMGHLAARRVCIENPLRVITGSETSANVRLVAEGNRP